MNNLKTFGDYITEKKWSTQDDNRIYSLEDLRKAFEEGYLLWNKEGNKYMGFQSKVEKVKKHKEEMMDKAFSKFIENNYS